MSVGTITAAESNRARLAWVRETTYKTAPTVVTDTQTTFSMSSVDNSINDSGSGFVTAGFVAGQFLDVSGFATNATNNERFLVVSVAAGKMILAENLVTTEAAGDSVTIVQGETQVFEYVTESLAQTTASTKSNTVTSNRRVKAILRTGVEAGGDVNFEVTAGDLDEFLKTLISSDDPWTDEVIVTGTTISFTAGSTIADSGSGFGSLVVGQWIEVSGAATAANNGVFKLATVAAGSITVEQGTLATESAGATVTVRQLSYVTDGTTCVAYQIERAYLDLIAAGSNEYARLAGQLPGSGSITVPLDGVLTGSITFLGSTEASASAALGNGSPLAAGTNPKMTSVDDVLSVFEASASYDVTGLSVQFQGNPRVKRIVGTLGAVASTVGRLETTGTHTAYYATKAVMDKYLAFTTSGQAFVLRDSGGKGYVFDFPSAKYVSGQRVSGGIDTDIIADMGWEAFEDATETVQVRIARI